MVQPGGGLEGRQQLERAARKRTARRLRSIRLMPRPMSNWCGVLGEQGKQAEEIDACRRALENSTLSGGRSGSNLGNALREAGLLDEAVQACRGRHRAWILHLPRQNNLGSALHDGGRHEEDYRGVPLRVANRPELAHRVDNLGGSLRSVYRYDEAVEAHRHAIQAQPGSAPFHFNFGLTLQHCGRSDDAIAQFRSTLELKPDDADAHCELSLALLGSGRLAEGWQEYEWRWRRPGAQASRHTGAQWDGDRSRQRRLLLWSEQGIGDQILYGSMTADLVDSALRVTLEMDPRLVTLFQRSFPRAAVAPAGYRLDRTERLRLPGSIGQPGSLAGRRSTLSASCGFLKADAARAGAYRAG